MGWTRVDAQTSLTPLSAPELFDILASQNTVLILDCRQVLSTGLLPRARVLRAKGNESNGEALDRVIEDCMWEDPPKDQSRAVLVGKRQEEGSDADILAEGAAYLRAKFGTKTVYCLEGGAMALEEDPRYSFLLGMSIGRAEALPSRLSDHIFIGSTLSAFDVPSLTALGITHVVSVLNRQLSLPHIAQGNHLVLRPGGVARESGTDGLRSLLTGAVPFVLAAVKSGRRMLIHCEDDTKASAASGIACASQIAEGSSGMNAEAAAAHLALRRPPAALRAAAFAQLKACEAWLREGAPPDVDLTDATDSIDPTTVPGVVPDGDEDDTEMRIANQIALRRLHLSDPAHVLTRIQNEQAKAWKDAVTGTEFDDGYGPDNPPPPSSWPMPQPPLKGQPPPQPLLLPKDDLLPQAQAPASGSMGAAHNTMQSELMASLPKDYEDDDDDDDEGFVG